MEISFSKFPSVAAQIPVISDPLFAASMCVYMCGVCAFVLMNQHSKIKWRTGEKATFPFFPSFLFLFGWLLISLNDKEGTKIF